MRFTQVLSKQTGHQMGRWIKRQWFFQSKKKVALSSVRDELEAMNIPVFKATDVVKEAIVPPVPKVEKIVGMRDLPPEIGENHPHWHDKVCTTYKDNNVLLGGFDQAKVFTNTVEIKQGLPEQIEALYDTVKVDKQDELVQMAIASALIYDSEQKILPLRFDPERTHVRLSREYGTTHERKNFILTRKLLHLCELFAGSGIRSDRYVFPDAFISVPLIREDDINQLQQTVNLLLLSRKALPPLVEPALTLGMGLPDIEPFKYNVSLTEENIYKLEDIYPVNENAEFRRTHTAIVHFDPTVVKNLYETPVLETQTIGRTLMKSFTIAAAEARFLYGPDVKILPKPIVVQCIHTDSQFFHFGVFQLNSLSWPPTESSVKNVFWSDALTQAYEFSGYSEAKPTIVAYNPDVFKKILAFYLNK